MECLHSVSFSFKYNNKIGGNLVPGRGLRQGDPIPPYIFLLCADGFFTLNTKATRDHGIHGVKICNGTLRISHLFLRTRV